MTCHHLTRALAVGLSLALLAGAASASDRHRGRDVDFVLRIGTGFIEPSLWYRDFDGFYYHRRHHPRGRFHRGLRTRTVVSRGGFIERLFIRRGRVIDSEIIGRVDRYGHRRLFRGERRFWGGYGDWDRRRYRHRRWDDRWDRRYDHRFDERRRRDSRSRDDRFGDYKGYRFREGSEVGENLDRLRNRGSTVTGSVAGTERTGKGRLGGDYEDRLLGGPEEPRREIRDRRRGRDLAVEKREGKVVGRVIYDQ